MTFFEPITSYEALAPELDALLKQKIVANYAPERQALEAEIAAGLLWAGRLPQGLVLLRRGGGPQRLRFLLTEPQALCGLALDRSTALELPFRSGDTRFPQLARALEGSGWAEALRRVRLSRRAGPRPSAQGAASPLLRPADEIPDPAALLRLLRCCFSPLTGCLPEQAELQADLAAGRVLALPGGLIRWREKGRSSEIRHLAVAPAQRGQGLSGPGGRQALPSLDRRGQSPRPPRLRGLRLRPRRLGIHRADPFPPRYEYIHQPMGGLNMREEILEILTDCCPDVDFEAETALIDDGLLESLDIVMIVTDLCHRFQVEINVDDLLPENFNSVDAIEELVRSKQA